MNKKVISKYQYYHIDVKIWLNWLHVINRNDSKILEEKNSKNQSLSKKLIKKQPKYFQQVIFSFYISALNRILHFNETFVEM